MHRQIRRHSTRRGNPLSSQRHLWTRVFHNGRRMLLDPAGSTQVTLGLHTVGAQRHQSSPCSGGGPVDESDAGALPVCLGTMDLQPHSPESPAPLPSSGSEIELSPIRRVYGQALQSEPQCPLQRAPSALNGPSPSSQEAHIPMCRTRTSRKLALELAVNLKGVSLKHYSSLGSLSPLSPQPQTSTSSCHSQGQQVTSSPEPTSSVKEEDNNHHVAVEMPSRETRGRGEKRRKRRSKGRLCSFNRTLNDEGGESEREMTACWDLLATKSAPVSHLCDGVDREVKWEPLAFGSARPELQPHPVAPPVTLTEWPLVRILTDLSLSLTEANNIKYVFFSLSKSSEFWTCSLGSAAHGGPLISG